jgi:formylglycine-generating enzyme required for sulfatase activity
VAAASLGLALSGCQQSLGLDDDGLRWACQDDAECGAGWWCAPAGPAGQGVCVARGTWGPDASGDAAPGPDGGADAAARADGADGADPGGTSPDGHATVDAPGPDVGALGDAAGDAAAAVDVGPPEPCGGCPEGFACVAGGCLRDGEVLLHAGPLVMGCNQAMDASCATALEEQPAHEVSVPAHLIDQREVTVAEYQQCVDASACGDTDVGPTCHQPGAGVDDHPRNCADRVHAQQYCAFVGKRVCSEAEWERAARGGCEVTPAPCADNAPTWPWGNAAASCARAVMTSGAGAAGCGELTTAPVGSKPEGKSPYGLDDMAGNVAEWVDDCWHGSYDGAPSDGTAWIDQVCETGVLRGGGYEHGASVVRASARLPLPTGPLFTSSSAGIRCCRSLSVP